MPVFPLLPDGKLFTRLSRFALWLAVVMLIANPLGAESADEQAASTDWLRRLAESGTSEGQMILLDQAMQGSAEAQYALAILFRGDSGIPADMNQARHWYQAAASRGHAAALESLRYLASEGDGAAFYALGVLNRDGLGVPRDLAKARQAFLWAGEAGHVEALFAAADMLSNGMGGTTDTATARATYAQVVRLCRSALKMDGEGNNDDRAAIDIRTAAQYWIAKVYLLGAGEFERDAVAAALWFADAASSGLGSAQYELGRLYLQGRGVPLDREKALVWLEYAAAQGVKGAAEEIAQINN
ncbi:MAG: tetratricopeptide repeat protein [Proteobacteria bacterium]|nr:tetratricopeptide repeat protein [Pseudomonadota bacterium]